MLLLNKVVADQITTCSLKKAPLQVSPMSSSLLLHEVKVVKEEEFI